MNESDRIFSSSSATYTKVPSRKMYTFALTQSFTVLGPLWGGRFIWR